MTSIVLTIDPAQDGGSVCAVWISPYVLANPHTVMLVNMDDLLGLNGPAATRQLGEQLAAKIRLNVNVDEVLRQALSLPARSPSLPICFRVGDAVAHGLSWEALVGNKQFVALDERWPIARIARGGNIPEGAKRVFEPPLKFAAVLSAVGRPAIKEWEGVYDAITEARADGLPIDVTLFAGEEAEVIDVVKALGDPHIDVRPVPQTATELIGALKRLEPHVLHLYCHGSIASDVHQLEFGTINDFDGGEGKSSVVLHVEELGVAMADASTWAVVLNTCRGAEVMNETLTHAEDIVSSGVPVAIGMRRLVDTDDAFAFSRAFYPAVFSAIAGATTAAAGGTVEWAHTLVQARRVLRDNHGADPGLDDAWTLPVLYTRIGSFELVAAGAGGATAATQELGENQTLAGIVDVLGDSASGDLLTDLRGLTPPSQG
jgi:hypothetical protein